MAIDEPLKYGVQLGSLRHVKKILTPVSILVPVYNEAEGIESFVVELVEVVYRYLPEGSEILIEEGGSTDGTGEILRDLKSRYPMLDIHSTKEKEGFAAAARKLYQRASNPLVFFIDSDGQCVIPEFWKLVDALDGNDIVAGTKKVRRDPFVRKVISNNFNFLARIIFGFPYRDINYGFRLCKKEEILKILDETGSMPTLINAEILIRAHRRGYRIAEVPVHHRPRLYGMSMGLKSNTLVRESLAAFVALLQIRTERPHNN